MIAFVRATLAAAMCLAAALLPGQVVAKDDPPLIYKVKPGDTLYSLADRYFVGRQVTGQVAAYNDIRDPNRIGVGKTLRIPRNLLRSTPVELTVRNFSGSPLIDGDAPTRQAVLNVGKIVMTGANGFITFQSKRGTKVSLPSNTSAMLIRAREYVLGATLDVDFKIIKGRGEVVAPKLKQQERFRIRTPLAVTAVRGTVFRVAHNEESAVSIAEVTEGAVAVEAGDETGLARSGFGVPLTAAGVGEMEALLPATGIVDPGAIQTKEDIKFTIVPMEGAARYRTRIANDASFLEVIDENVGAEREVTFAGLPNGKYYVRSRGVSATGVEGISDGTHRFTRKRLGVAASAEPSELEDGFKFLWRGEGASDSSFGFQLWNEAAPDQLIVDEVGVQEGGVVVTGLGPGIYLWRVAATSVDADGFLKVWSPEQKLNVAE